MKHLLFLGALLCSHISFAFEGNYSLMTSDANFDFIAPSVPSTSDAPNQVGLIVHQTSDNAFYGHGTGSSDWQRLSNDLSASVIPGVVVAYVGSSAPTGYLLCDGSAVSRSTYSALYAIIGTQFGNGDGSTTFNLPDLRGKFIRGWANGSSSDPDRSSRTTCATGGSSGDNIGSCQADQIKAHTHAMGGSTATGANGGWFTTIHDPGAPGVNSGSTGGNETRPTNVALNYLIKY